MDRCRSRPRIVVTTPSDKTSDEIAQLIFDFDRYKDARRSFAANWRHSIHLTWETRKWWQEVNAVEIQRHVRGWQTRRQLCQDCSMDVC
jgi:hypothetical protein